MQSSVERVEDVILINRESLYYPLPKGIAMSSIAKGNYNVSSAKRFLNVFAVVLFSAREEFNIAQHSYTSATAPLSVRPRTSDDCNLDEHSIYGTNARSGIG